MNTLLAVTAQTWIVTGLGFGIVLVLLVFLIFVLLGFGAIMQKILAPKAEKPAASAPKPAAPKIAKITDASEAEMVAIAYALSQANDNDKVAIAVALHLYYNNAHDIPTSVMAPQARPTAWNHKSVNMNNVGF